MSNASSHRVTGGAGDGTERDVSASLRVVEQAALHTSKAVPVERLHTDANALLKRMLVLVLVITLLLILKLVQILILLLLIILVQVLPQLMDLRMHHCFAAAAELVINGRLGL